VTRETPLVDRIAIWIAVFGGVLTAGAYLFGGWHFGMSALVGAVVGFANWIALRWIGMRLVRGASGPGGKKPLFSLLLVLKMGAVLALVAFLLMTGIVDAVGFVIGMGALVLGVAVGGLQLANAAALAEGEEEQDAAR
jgi:hypothetical protein